MYIASMMAGDRKQGTRRGHPEQEGGGGWGRGRLTASWLYRIHVSEPPPPPLPPVGVVGRGGEGGLKEGRGMGGGDLSPPISSAHVDHMLQESPKPSLPRNIWGGGERGLYKNIILGGFCIL
jgi:hypothetical protein